MCIYIYQCQGRARKIGENLFQLNVKETFLNNQSEKSGAQKWNDYMLSGLLETVDIPALGTDPDERYSTLQPSNSQFPIENSEDIFLEFQ